MYVLHVCPCACHRLILLINKNKKSMPHLNMNMFVAAALRHTTALHIFHCSFIITHYVTFQFHTLCPFV